MNQDEKLAELEAKQAELSEMAAALAHEPNADKLMEKAKVLQAKGLELQMLAAAYQAEADLTARMPERGRVVIELTPEQTREIQAETGVEMFELVLENQPMWKNEKMPRKSPDSVKALAMAQARAEAKARIAEAEARANLEGSLAGLEKAAETNKELRPHIKKLREDPTVKALLSKG
jgi:hypothetical protein